MLLQELISKITIPMREETLEYLINVKEETLEFYKVGKYIKLEEKGFDRKKLSLMKSDAYKAMKEIINECTKSWFMESAQMLWRSHV